MYLKRTSLCEEYYHTIRLLDILIRLHKVVPTFYCISKKLSWAITTIISKKWFPPDVCKLNLMVPVKNTFWFRNGFNIKFSLWEDQVSVGDESILSCAQKPFITT